MNDLNNPIDQFRRRLATALRSRPTDAETKLWKLLKRFPIEGSHFRRQVPIGAYVADFACMATRIVIEVDGSQHAEVEGILKDSLRMQWLESQGYKVARFWNSDITGSQEAVLDALYSGIYGSVSADTRSLKHIRTPRNRKKVHPTPARAARRPSPSRGG